VNVLFLEFSTKL